MPRDPPVTSAVFPARLLSMGGPFSSRARGLSTPLRKEAGLQDGVELREIAFQVLIPLFLDPLLIGALPAGSALPVAGVEALDDLHPFHHLAGRRGAPGIQPRALGADVDDDLPGPRAGSAGREGDASRRVALRHGLVRALALV